MKLRENFNLKEGNVDRSHVVAPLDIVWWGVGGTWVKEGFTLHAHYCLKNPGGVLNFELGTDVRPKVSTTTL